MGRMTAIAAMRLGMSVRTLSPTPAGPVAGLGEAMVGDWTDPAVLRRFADGCDAITVESEWAPAELLAPVLRAGVRLYPTPATLHTIRHKGRQKMALREGGLPTADFRLAATLGDAQIAAQALNWPVVLKRFEGSYDGYGNGVAHNADELADLWPRIAGTDGLLVEAMVSFRQELSVLVVRTESGHKVAYPAAHTEQRNHRCHAVVVPASLSPALASRAETVALAAADTVGSVGILGVELFETDDDQILVNELAPRPHNTGHYSIEGSHTSQFENHARAVVGWPLGDPGLRAPVAVMINVLGTRSGPVSSDSMAAALEVPGVSIHLYGKEESRPDRKMGHVTATGADAGEVRARAERAASLIVL
ncbi:MAG: 5-(carboxyamino)imidazole ribonucleotide synthase [Rhodothermales bacterium]